MMKGYLLSDFKDDISKFRETLMEVKNAMVREDIGIFSDGSAVATKNLRNSLNDLLRDWEKSGVDALKIFATYQIKHDAGINAMAYNFFKEMVYSDFDYAAVTGFVSGIQQGIADGVIKTSMDVNDFKAATLQQAFKGLWPDTAETTRILAMQATTKVPMTDVDEQMIRNLQGRASTVLNLAERHELHTSVMTAIANTKPIISDQQNANLKIGIATNVFEFILFEVIAYIGRIMIINTMISDIVATSNTAEASYSPDPEDVITESTLAEIKVPEYAKECPVESLQLIDTSMFRDPNQFKQFLGMIIELHDKCCSEAYDKEGISIYDKKVASTLTELLGEDVTKNMFLCTVTSWRYDVLSSNDYASDSANLRYIHDILEDSIIAPLNGLNKEPSPFRKVIHGIAHATYGKDLKSLEKLMRDICTFTDAIGYRIINKIAAVNTEYTDSSVTGLPKGTISDRKIKSEINLLLVKAYQELMYAIYLRLMYLCEEMNKCNQHCKNQFDQAVAFDIPALFGETDCCDNMSDYMQRAIPDGMRMLNWNECFDVLPEYEALSLYNEYVQSLPGFENDPYFTEAGADIINTMISLISGLFNSAAAFFGKFKPASDWVSKHESELKGLEFAKETKMEEIIPYKIENTDKYVAGLDKLKNVDVKTAVKDVDKFTAELYGSDTIYNWFKTDASTAPKKFENMVLFGDTSGSENAPNSVTLAGDQIAKSMTEWVDDVMSADSVLNHLKSYTNDFKAAINRLKSSGTQYFKESAYFAEAEEAAPPNDVPEANISEDNKSGTADNTKRPESEAKPAEKKPEVTSEQFNDLLARTNKAMINLCKPLYSGVAKAMRDEYGYIKKAYSLAKKSATTTENSNPKDGTV